jgi:hypothetical protein
MPRTDAQKTADAKSQKKIYATFKIRKEIMAKLEEYADYHQIDKQVALIKLLNNSHKLSK